MVARGAGGPSATSGEHRDRPPAPGESGQQLTLDIDPTTHPAWTGGQQQLMDRGGRLTRFNKKFAGILKA